MQMKAFKIFFLFLVICSAPLFAQSFIAKDFGAKEIDKKDTDKLTDKPQNRDEAIKELSKKISSPEGLRIAIHGASHDSKMYVGRYIYDNIFNAVQVSLLTRDQGVKNVFATLTRHDVVRVWGRLLDFDAPQPHLGISKIVIEKSFEFPGEDHKRDVDWKAIARELLGEDQITVEIHTVQVGGSLLVVEYKGFVFPIFTKKFKEEAKDLNRQDFARIHFEIQEDPGKPIHLVLNEGPRGKAIELLDSISDQHGVQKTVTGKLIMFPQSPTIKFNVFAVKTQTDFDIARTYTIINFEDFDLFMAVLAKLQKVWDANKDLEDCVANDRNKLINKCIEIEVSGPINYVDPNQANPQVLIQRLEDVKTRVVIP